MIEIISAYNAIYLKMFSSPSIKIYELNNEAAKQQEVLKLQIDVKNQEIQCIRKNIDEMQKKLELAQM